MSGSTWLILLVIVAIVVYVLWRRSQDARPEAPRSPNGRAPVTPAEDLLPQDVTPERIRALPLDAFVKFDPEGPALDEELQVRGKATLLRATTDVDMTKLSGRLEDWLSAYYETGQQDTLLALQDKDARFSVLTELFTGGWGYYSQITELSSEDTNLLRDAGGAGAASFDWRGQAWRKTGDVTYKVRAQGESFVEDGTLLRALAATSADSAQSFVFLDQWSGRNFVMIGSKVELDDVITEIM